MRISDWSSDVCSSDLDCWFDFEFRYLPEQDGEMLFAAFENYVRGTLEPEMHAVDPATGFDFQELSAIPALNIDPGDEVVNRSEERRVGKECVSTCSSRWSP